MSDIIGLRVSEKDNTAVVFSEDVREHDTLHVRGQKGDIQKIDLLSSIPYGHKVAVRPIEVGSPILKYGEEIGVATHDIKVGEHVHVHNLDSQRSRGDK